MADVDHDCLENLEEHPRKVEVWCEDTVQVRKKCTVCGHEIHELYDIAAFYDETEGRWIKRRGQMKEKNALELRTEDFGSCEIISEILKILEALEKRDESEFDYETDMTDARRLRSISRKALGLAGNIRPIEEME